MLEMLRMQDAAPLHDISSSSCVVLQDAYIEELQFCRFTADAIRKKQYIALVPCHWLQWILV